MILDVVCKYCSEQEDDELRKADELRWQTIYGQLQTSLRKGVTRCLRTDRMSQKAADKYFVSGLHNE